MKDERLELDLRARMRLGRAIADRSQRATAEELGMSPWRYWRIERGVCEPNRDELCRIQLLLREIGTMGV